MRLLWFLCCLRLYSTEEFKNLELPFTTPLFPLTVGDSIVIATQLEAKTGLLISLGNGPEEEQGTVDGKIEILHVELCSVHHEGYSVTDWFIHQKWMKHTKYHCSMEPGETLTIKIVVEENQFVIDLFGSEVTFSHKLPLVLGKSLGIEREGISEGEARVLSVKIERNPQKPAHFLPRYGDSDGERQLLDTIFKKDGMVEECSEKAIEERKEFYWFEGSEPVCRTNNVYNASIPYFQLFPRWFESCPCTCFSDPNDAKILKILSTYSVVDPNKFTTIILEDWSLQHDLLVHFSGEFSVAFFERPSGASDNCDRWEQSAFLWSKSEYEGSDNVLKIRKMNEAPFYSLSTSPSENEINNENSKSLKNIGFLKIKGVTKLEYTGHYRT